jgi:hypothetical protein
VEVTSPLLTEDLSSLTRLTNTLTDKSNTDKSNTDISSEPSELFRNYNKKRDYMGSKGVSHSHRESLNFESTLFSPSDNTNDIDNTDDIDDSIKPPTPSIPWFGILTSAPFIVLIFNHFAWNWGTYIFLSWLPTYLKDVFHFDINSGKAFLGIIRI